MEPITGIRKGPHLDGEAALVAAGREARPQRLGLRTAPAQRQPVGGETHASLPATSANSARIWAQVRKVFAASCLRRAGYDIGPAHERTHWPREWKDNRRWGN